MKARYSKHFEISEEALAWLSERTALLLETIKAVCVDRFQLLQAEIIRPLPQLPPTIAH